MTSTKPELNENKETESQKDFIGVWEQFKAFLKELLNIRIGCDPSSTIEGITKDIPFKGHTAWILIFSILIASIGLNTNSTAVVIGAMLISPLMGPILGIGLSVGINDIDTLRRSIVNFGVMVFLSVLTAFLYFKISPFQTASSEILARTQPTLLDVLIAIFGGFAGIVAGSRKEKSNAIPGVAIATALMPPLCTAGFGLATGNIEYFIGALYLFLINTVFIALSTFIVVKYLRFPLAKYATAKKRKKVNRIVALVALLMIAPSIFTFKTIIERSFYAKEAGIFIDKYIIYDGAEIIKKDIDDRGKKIDILLIGESVPESVISDWQKRIQDDYYLVGTKLSIRQGQDKISDLKTEMSKVKEGLIKDLFMQNNNSQALSNKETEILLLKNDIQQLERKLEIKSNKNKIPLLELSNEVKINYPNVETISYAKVITSNFKKLDTISVVSIKWNRKARIKTKNEEKKKLAQWFKFKLELDTIAVKELK